MNFITQSNHALVVRNFTPKFSYADRDEMLYGLQATSVHNYPNYSVAFFPNENTCFMVIRLLHQRLLGSKRLRVEFAPQQKVYTLTCHSSFDASLKRKILNEQRNCSQSSSKYNFGLKCDITDSQNFQFPQATLPIVRRIALNILKNEDFYQQVLLLMIKCHLNPPFEENNDSNENEIFFDNDIVLPKTSFTKRTLESDESEIEDFVNEKDLNTSLAPKFILDKRKKKRKKLSTGIVGEKTLPINKTDCDKTKSTVDKHSTTTTIEQVFDQNEHKITFGKKEISVEIKSNSIDANVIGTTGDDGIEEEMTKGFGQLPSVSDRTVSPGFKPKNDTKQSNLFDLALLKPEDIISDDELKQKRLPQKEWINYTVFSNYQTGDVSHRLYVKNIHRKTALNDLYRIYAKFIDYFNQKHLDGFNIVYMEKGRMRGQAFVTFPEEQLAEIALKQTNGLLIHDKPIVVSFARSCKAPSDTHQ